MKTNKTVRVGIIGASGYSGEELIRLLLKHTECRIEFITSRQHNGKTIGEVFPRFAEKRLKFILPDITEIIKSGVDLVYLALPHGLALEYGIPLLKSGLKVIDLSADFRLNSSEKYKKYYNLEHPAPELLAKAVYGLPELYRKKIETAELVACPGCYPTSIILPLVPLLKEKLITTNRITVSSGSGISGAGRKVDLPYIYPECNESFRAYAPCRHRHLPEIEQELEVSSGISEVMINFIPHLVPMNRGINSTLVLQLSCSACDVTGAASEIYKKYYGNEPFIRILPEGRMADTKHVIMSNICEIGHVVDPRTDTLIVTSVIDNLTKGAAGQAVQCMNIMYGIEEDRGLS
jgi:N-acetyl-gamma-glutamyl-phosphate reductase